MVAKADHPRLCLWCVHFRIQEGFGGTSVTPAEMPFVSCLLSIWYQSSIEDVEEWRKVQLRAQTCDHYQEGVEEEIVVLEQ